MTRQEFLARANRKVMLLDGATGSNLLKRGMPRNACAESWILEHPDLLKDLQNEYIEAGSEIIYAPSFGANRIALERHGMCDRAAELNKGLAELSSSIAAGRALVAGDLTTPGEPLEPIGELEEAELFDVYVEQIQALLDGGVDLLVAETMLSVQETAMAVRAARSLTDLPMLCTITVQEDGRALFGGTAVEAVQILQEEGADAVGINCSAGPEQLLPLVEKMKRAAQLPIIVKPNAGLPQAGADGQLIYPMDAETFAGHMRRIVEAGANLIGGCCGTTPDFIRAIAKLAV